MTKVWAVWVLAGVLMSEAVWAVGAGSPMAARSVGQAGATGKSDAASEQAANLADFERNLSLGQRLTASGGSDQEYDELQKLAEHGLKVARELAARSPAGAEAEYLLGSWLIYGYRIVVAEHTLLDEAGQSRVTRVKTVVQGLSDDPAEGLEALRRAAELAPQEAHYTIDYAAALHDTGNPLEAVGILLTAWSGKPQLSALEKMRVGLLLSDAYAAEERFPEARQWLYSTLLLNPDNAEIVSRLRMLDAVAPRMPPPAQDEGAAVQEFAPGGPPEQEAPGEFAPEDESEVWPEFSEEESAQPAPEAEQEGGQEPPLDQGESEGGGADERTLSPEPDEETEP